MCTQRLIDVEKGTSYSCRKCDQCRAQAVNDIKGRLIAEHKMWEIDREIEQAAGMAAEFDRVNRLRLSPGALLSAYRNAGAVARTKAAHFVTLTYGFDQRYYGEHVKNPRSQQFYWEDIRQWRQRLWKNGFKHRAYIVGECGDKNGRVHWHLVVWWSEAPPSNIVLDKRYIHELEPGRPLWSHGWSYWEEMTLERIGYTVSYLYKNGRIGDTGIDGRGYAGRKFYGGTTKPALGARYFVEVEARRYIDQRLSPRQPIYRFPDVRKFAKKVTDANGFVTRVRGEPFDFFLPPGATRRAFLDAFVLGWIERYGNDRWPQSDMVDEHYERMAVRFRRDAGVPDQREGEFNDEFFLRRYAKRNGHKAYQAIGPDERLRHRVYRELQDSGMDVDIPGELAGKLGPGFNRAAAIRQGDEP